MGTNECSQPASKSSWDSQDFGDITMVLKMANFRKSTRPRWAKLWFGNTFCITMKVESTISLSNQIMRSCGAFLFVSLNNDNENKHYKSFQVQRFPW